MFQDIEIEFNEGLNVIIGENNSGKQPKGISRGFKKGKER